ncbi:hypothetical protein A6301_19805 [Pectobacterium sp. IFB5596]|nr:hypothetical protein [Pectobacterium sp. IFB5596]
MGDALACEKISALVVGENIAVSVGAEFKFLKVTLNFGPALAAADASSAVATIDDNNIFFVFT